MGMNNLITRAEAARRIRSRGFSFGRSEEITRALPVHLDGKRKKVASDDVEKEIERLLRPFPDMTAKSLLSDRNMRTLRKHGLVP
jgi:hypothetical protein